LKSFLSQHGDKMEFCQLQLNYVDWSLQNGKAKCELLAEYGIPVWVMEPVRGGKLAKLSESDMAPLKAIDSDRSAAEWAFRWLLGIDNVGVILSGMSNMSQLEENTRVFSEDVPLDDAEISELYKIADRMKTKVPCTACRYCTDGCPQGIDIPEMLALYNEICMSPSFNIGMRVDAVKDGCKPSDCISCGNCTQICPQGINIPAALKDFSERLEKLPKWADICKAREEAAKKSI